MRKYLYHAVCLRQQSGGTRRKNHHPLSRPPRHSHHRKGQLPCFLPSYLPLQYTGLLGFVPILLGVRALLQRSDTDEEDVPAANDIGVFGMALTTLGNGADNLGVYIPLFTGFTGGQCLIAVLVFTVLTALWLWLAQTLAGLPRLHSLLQKYRHIAVPAILLTLGICIILGSGLFG